VTHQLISPYKNPPVRKCGKKYLHDVVARLGNYLPILGEELLVVSQAPNSRPYLFQHPQPSVQDISGPPAF
jgi:hypothetical protein